MGKLSALRIGHLKIVDHLILGFAYDGSGQALLKHTGHLMEAVPMGSWGQIKKAFCDGDLHGAFIPLPEAIALFESGMELKVLLYDCRCGASLIGNSLTNIEKLRDFKGKRVLISNYLSVHHLLFYRLMASVGLRAGLENSSHTDVYIEIVPPFIVPEMLRYDNAGEIAGCFIEDPFGSMVITDGLGKLLLSSLQLWSNHPCSVLVFHDYVIKDYRRHLMDIIHLIVATSHFICKNSYDLNRLSCNFFDKDIKLQKSQSENTSLKDRVLNNKFLSDFIFLSFLPNRANSLMPDIKSIETINRFMVKEMGIIKNLINVGELVDISFALEAGA